MSLKDAVNARFNRVMGAAVHRGWEWARRTGEITPGSQAGGRFGYLGAGSCIGFPVGALFGERWIHVGADTLIGTHVSLSAGFGPGHVVPGERPIVRIGERCSIGRGSHVVGHESIEIGDDVFAGPYVYITDQNHAYTDVELPVGRQWPVNSPVSIGPGSWLGAGAIVLPGARLGANVVVAAGSVVRGEFPDHCVIAGVPARVVRQHMPGTGWQPMAPAPGRIAVRRVLRRKPAGREPERRHGLPPIRSGGARCAGTPS